MLLPVVLVFSLTMLRILSGIAILLGSIMPYQVELSSKYIADINVLRCTKIIARNIAYMPQSVESDYSTMWLGDGDGGCEYRITSAVTTDNIEEYTVDINAYSTSQHGAISQGGMHGENNAMSGRLAHISRKYEFLIKFVDRKINSILIKN